MDLNDGTVRLRNGTVPQVGPGMEKGGKGE
jgi:hypothetical protein